MNQYDPNTIINEANTSYNDNPNGLESAQMIYQSALLDWVDDAREMQNNNQDVSSLKDAIALLWIEYAKLNKKANMFKAATEAFEQAVNCPIASNVGKIWQEYALFQQERNRYKSAQSIYLRALVGDKQDISVSDQNMLWNDFLDMMKRKNNDDSLTLEQLREAVDTEHTVKSSSEDDVLPMQVPSSMTVPTTSQPPAKRAKVEDDAMLIDNNRNKSQPISNITKISAESVQSVATLLSGSAENISESAALKAEWLARDGNSMPTRPEPPLFTPSPPKLGDPSGKDLLGTELALKLIRLLLNKSMDGESNMTELSGSVILDIVNGCWMMTALKEKEAATSQAALDKKLLADYEKMDTELDARLYVAGNAITAVEQMNASEKNHFITMCNEQRRQLQSLIAWEFRYLLAIQQEIMTKSGLPYFDGPTTDARTIHIQANICAFLHSAFYLRNRIGEKSHITMLTAQESKLTTQELVPMPLPQAETLPPPPAFFMPPPPPPPIALSQPIYAGQQPVYASHQSVPSQFPPPPPTYFQNQYPYR